MESRINKIGREYHSVAAVLLLFGIHVYVARELFMGRPTAYMNSMHGFWMALARQPWSAWLWPTWWPYWDCGMPLEYTYPPLVPLLTKAVGFPVVTGIAYALGPLALFLLCVTLSESPAWSFVAAAVYSLYGEPQRFYLLAVWDETPHILATSLAMIALALLIRKTSLARVALCIALALAANAFALTFLALAGVCLIASVGKRMSLPLAASGFLGYLAVCAWLPPSLFRVIAAMNQTYDQGKITPLSAAVLMGAVLLFAALSFGLARLIHDQTLRFFTLLAFVFTVIVLAHTRFGLVLLPQPDRYKIEMELALAGLSVFAVRPLLNRARTRWRVALAIALLLAAVPQVIHHRRFAKNILQPKDPSQTLEHDLALWCARSPPGERILLPGSLGMWANAFADVVQFGGGSFSTALNPAQQAALLEVLQGKDAATSIRLLQQFGVRAVAVPGKQSPEFWKAVTFPEKFEGKLEVLWHDRDTTVYRVPASPSQGSAPFNYHPGWRGTPAVKPDESGLVQLPAGAVYTGGLELQIAHVVSAMAWVMLIWFAWRNKPVASAIL